MSKPQQSEALKAAQAKTLARLGAIQRQFNETKRGTRFADFVSGGEGKGRVAIITGAGSEKGIGRASARLLAREGAQAIYVADYNADSLPDLKKELETKYPGLKVYPIQCDAADEKAIADMCQRAIAEHGRLDAFFANAGIVGINLLNSTEPDEYMETFRVNSLSCFLAIKHASEAMKVVQKDSGKTETGGSIILTASVAGIRSGAGPMDYSASKSSVINLANTGAQALAGTNIRVNAICPGLIETGMTTYTFERAKERGSLGKVGQLNPLKRFGVAEEIAQAVLFLASDDSSYINGIHLPVDGGLVSSSPVVPGQAF